MSFFIHLNNYFETAIVGFLLVIAIPVLAIVAVLSAPFYLIGLLSDKIQGF